MANSIKSLYKRFMRDSLYRNSVYLMLGTFIMAVLGFVAWAIIARLYTAEQVGLATTIISVMGLITSISLLGLNTGLIRFLPKSDSKNDKINTAFTLAILVTIIITVIFLLGLQGFSPKLLFIKQNIFYSFIFIVFMVFSTSSALLDSIFIAYRSTKYILIKNSIFSLLKLIFPVMLVFLGAYGIFGSWMLSLIIGFLTAFIVLMHKFNYKPKIVFHDKVITKIGKYSFGNYLSGIVSMLPNTLIPILITNLHHPEFTAYYYITMSIAAVLFIIPNATTNALFAEGSNNQKSIKENTKKAIKIISILLIPAIIITILVGKYVLLFFGQQYSAEGFKLLQILAIASIFVTINAVYSAILQVKKRIGALIWVNLIGTIFLIPAIYFVIKSGYGLEGIGLVWVGEQILTAAIFYFYKKN